MIGVDLIGGIRRAYFEQRLPIKEIVRRLAVSRATVRRVIRSQKTEFKYERCVQPVPKLGEWVAVLSEMLEKEAQLPRRERRSTQRLFEELRGRGMTAPTTACTASSKRGGTNERVPACRLCADRALPRRGISVRLEPMRRSRCCESAADDQGAHMKLSHSRMLPVRAYFRERPRNRCSTLTTRRAAFGGVCRRGIYDNMKTAVEVIFVGKARQYNRRFLQMCSHHLIEPVACTPRRVGRRTGREPGRQSARPAVPPKPRVKSLAELNAWLADQCIAYARRTLHPEFKDRTIWEVFQDERASLWNFAARSTALSRRRCAPPAPA
jgi:hypothetical protein